MHGLQWENTAYILQYICIFWRSICKSDQRYLIIRWKILWPLEITLLFLILTVHQQLSSISQRISCQKCFNDDVGSFRYQRYRYRYCSTRNEKYQDRGFEQEEHLCDDEAKIYIKEKQNFELTYHFFATVKILYISCSGVPRFF